MVEEELVTHEFKTFFISNEGKGEIEYLFYDFLFMHTFDWHDNELLLDINILSEHYTDVEWDICKDNINKIIREDKKARIYSTSNIEVEQGKVVVKEKTPPRQKEREKFYEKMERKKGRGKR